MLNKPYIHWMQKHWHPEVILGNKKVQSRINNKRLVGSQSLVRNVNLWRKKWKTGTIAFVSRYITVL